MLYEQTNPAFIAKASQQQIEKVKFHALQTCDKPQCGLFMAASPLKARLVLSAVFVLGFDIGCFSRSECDKKGE